MAYEFEVGAPEPVFVGNNEYIVDFDLGVDEDLGEQIIMSVALIEDPESGGDPFGLVFGIRRKSLVTGVTSDPIFDHATARTYVSRANAHVVMPLVLACVRSLVEYVNPSTVTMVTYEPDLNVAGMAKYTRISNHMGILGYTQTEYRRDGTDLKDYWLFTK